MNRDLGNADDNSDEAIDAVMVHQPEGFAIDWKLPASDSPIARHLAHLSLLFAVTVVCGFAHNMRFSYSVAVRTQQGLPSARHQVVACESAHILHRFQ